MGIVKRIVVLGSTGSIGMQSLEVVRANPDEFTVTALAVRSDVENLEKQVREFQPRMVCIWDEGAARAFKEKTKDCPTEVAVGMEGLLACASHADADAYYSTNDKSNGFSVRCVKN